MTVELAGPRGDTVADLEVLETALAAMSDSELADALADATTDARAATARQAAVVFAVQNRVEAQGYLVSGAAETIAAITTTSTRSATYLMGISASVCSRPAVWTALATGSIDLARARLICDAFLNVPESDRDDLERRALDYASDHTAHQTRRHLARMLIDFDPDLVIEQQERDRQAAWDKRHLAIHPREHGMADVSGYLPSGTAQILLDALDDVARSYSDERTLDQKRVDALAQILAENAVLDISVDVVIPADTLAGLQQSGASIDGYGPCDAQHALTLALNEDARWRRLVTDPVTGTLSDVSTDQYRIPAPLKRAVRKRDRTCRFPGCATRARHTDTDHVVPFPDGLTEAANLASLCRRHHRAKTHSGWTYRMHPDGSQTWTSPLGTKHTSAPWDYNNPAA